MFFEEGMKNGGIAEHFLSLLIEKGFKGTYSISALEKFVKQASVKNQLAQNGLYADGMYKKIMDISFGE